MIATDKLTDGQLIELPDEAGGDPSGAAFEPNDDWLRGADATQQKTAMWRWFATHYAEPAETMPHDENGEYLYTDGGPYRADRVLRERFGSSVPVEVLDALIASVESEVGTDWALKPIDKESG